MTRTMKARCGEAAQDYREAGFTLIELLIAILLFALLSTAAAVEGHVEPTLAIGNNVVIGAGALLQSCTVEDGAAVGAGAIALEGSLVEKAAQLAPGAVLHSGRRVPAGQLWAGNPAVFVRELSKAELAAAEGAAEREAETAAMHAAAFPPASGEAARNALA